MVVKASRDCRIAYDADGAGATAAAVIAIGMSDSITINNEGIDVTSKDDNGLMTYLNRVGVKDMKMKWQGILADNHKTLIGLFANAGDNTALAWFEFQMAGVGTFRGQWLLSSIEIGADDPKGEATIAFDVASSGAITWTAAP